MRIEGLNEVVADLGQASATIASRAGKVVEKTTKRVAQTGSDLAPRDRPELANRIKAKVKGTRGEAVAEASTSPRVMPHMVEYGTYKDAPQAFMGPALDRHSGEFVSELEEIAGDV